MTDTCPAFTATTLEVVFIFAKINRFLQSSERTELVVVCAAQNRLLISIFPIFMQYLGIPFVISNYFYGNKSVFATLNSHQRTFLYDFGRLPCKNRTASGDFFTAKML